MIETIWGEMLYHSYSKVPMFVLCSSFFVLCILMVFYYNQRQKRAGLGKPCIVAMLIDVVWLILCTTLLYRASSGLERHAEIMPFWNYEHIFRGSDISELWEVILNVFLYIPIGILLSLLVHKNKIVISMTFCASLSAIIESMQFVLNKGLCETDDVIHNTLGGIIGCLMVNILSHIKEKINAKDVEILKIWH